MYDVYMLTGRDELPLYDRLVQLLCQEKLTHSHNRIRHCSSDDDGMRTPTVPPPPTHQPSERVLIVVVVAVVLITRSCSWGATTFSRTRC